ncbi:MAG TPA: tetratricopeptide repeat protein [Vulgatibacter sp.]
MHGTDWLPGIIALALGLVGGAFLWLRHAKGAKTAPAFDPRQAKLEELRARRDLAVARLREIGPDAGHDLAAERSRLEVEVAQTLRSLDQLESAAPSGTQGAPVKHDNTGAPGVTGTGFFASRPVLRGFLWGAGTASFLFLLVFFLGDLATPGKLGGPPMGPAGVMGASADDGAPDPELDQLRATVAAHPQDAEMKLDLAQALLFRDRLLEAFNVVQEVTKAAPDNPRALTYEGVVRSAMGQQERAVELLDRAVQLDPMLTEAWVRRGLAAFDMGRYQVAIESWERALEQRPDGRAALQPVIAEARARLEGGAEAGATTPVNAAPAAAPHPEAAPPAAGARQAGDILVSLDLDPALAGKVQPGSIVFVTVRQAGVTAGPPVAAKRIPAGDFPLAVSIGGSDTMMGQPMPESVSLEARIDRDGNAMTKDPDDPVARADGIRAGGEPVRLVLRAP